MIVQMKKLLLAARSTEREQVLEILRQAAVVHVAPAEPEQVKVPGSLGEAIEACSRALNILAQIEVTGGTDRLASPGTPTRLIEETLSHFHEVASCKDKFLMLNRQLDEIRPWGELGLKDLAWLKAAGLHISFMKGLARAEFAIVADAVTRVYAVDTEAVFLAVSRQPIAIPEGFVEVIPPARESAEIIEEIQNCQQNLHDHQQALHSLALRREDLEKHLTKLLNRKRYAEVESGVHNAEEIFVLTGWCPEDKQISLQKTFEEAEISVGIDFSLPAADEIPPTMLANKPWAESIQPMYDFMGMTPSYNEPDVSAIFLLTLTLFASFLVADAGYGLMVFLPLLIGYKALVARGVDAKLLRLGMFLYGGATIYGVLTNTWFGHTFRLVESYQFNPESPEGSFMLQGLCLFIGIVHLTAGHLMKIARRKVDLTLLSEIGWILFLWGMYGLICQMLLGKSFVMPSEWSIPLFKVSVVLIFAFTAPSFNIFKSIMAGFTSMLMNASAAFSDILSYIRLWAVGLAGGKLAAAFNNISAMLPAVNLFGLALPLLQIPLLIVGHLGNMILGIIGILAHGVRLNLLEFSNHLELDWAGHKYEPFKEIK